MLNHFRSPFQQGPRGVVERPYDPPLGPGVVAHVQMARSAEHWRSDIEALLVENEMPVECADAVIGLVDTFGMSIRSAVSQIKPLLAGGVEDATQ